MRAEVLKQVFGNRRPAIGLRMAPMIDVIFLLLIFFLVAAKWRPEENFLPFQLPIAQAALSYNLAKPEPLTIHIFATETGCQVRIGRFGAVQINDKTVEADLVLLMETIGDCLAGQKRFASDPVEIVCDAAVKWEHMAKIYNMLFGASMTDITFRMTH